MVYIICKIYIFNHKTSFQGEYVLPNNKHVSKHSSVVRCNKMFLMIKGYLSLFDESVRTFNWNGRKYQSVSLGELVGGEKDGIEYN